MLSLKPWGAAARYVTPEVMVSHLSQVARYLARKEPDAHGTSFDGRIRARVAEAVGDGPAVVVAHSPGSVVALESLHHLASPVPLFVSPPIRPARPEPDRSSPRPRPCDLASSTTAQVPAADGERRGPPACASGTSPGPGAGPAVRFVVVVRDDHYRSTRRTRRSPRTEATGRPQGKERMWASTCS
ncbi:hypothetical protein OHA91_06475 [Streptomyces erythrochromogenes]|uniref:Uncharacterized protein n=1 Tax=Streptomyces erythrochromogenes TaxID=285574 RepID=A0ABZ1Q638_9ACTN|nr:hypothetical protein [Streptomyces erythrochromogenes]